VTTETEEEWWEFLDHEVRQPISVVTGFLDILGEEEAQDEGYEKLMEAGDSLEESWGRLQGEMAEQDHQAEGIDEAFLDEMARAAAGLEEAAESYDPESGELSNYLEIISDEAERLRDILTVFRGAREGRTYLEDTLSTALKRSREYDLGGYSGAIVPAELTLAASTVVKDYNKHVPDTEDLYTAALDSSDVEPGLEEAADEAVHVAFADTGEGFPEDSTGETGGGTRIFEYLAEQHGVSREIYFKGSERHDYLSGRLSDRFDVEKSDVGGLQVLEVPRLYGPVEP
jgi:hypothetical protein